MDMQDCFDNKKRFFSISNRFLFINRSMPVARILMRPKIKIKSVFVHIPVPRETLQKFDCKRQT
jgi:hypothetical protein